MTMNSPIKSLLFLSVSAAMAGCTVDVEDPTNARPVIHLKGEQTIELALNEAYIEPGYQALDTEDGDITVEVLSNSAIVNSSVAGQYQITYGVSDSGNLAATPAKRLVIVAAASNTDGGVVDGGEGPGDDSLDPVEGEAPVIDEPVVIEEPVVIDEPVVIIEEPVIIETPPADGSIATDVPAISSFKLLAYTQEGQRVQIAEVTDGSAVDLSLMPSNLLNVEAVSEDATKTGSVHFTLEGPVTLDRYENNAIYTLQTEPAQLNTMNGELPVGEYSLTVTPYSAADMGGTKGSAKKVIFKVKDTQIEVSPVPKVLAVDFVTVNEGTGDLDTLARITEGYNLDLGTVPAALVNVVAISEDTANTGSVHFFLNGPTSIDRYENAARYTMAAEPAAIDITKDGLLNGDYTLIVTPYADADMGGEAGIPLMVNFTVSGTAQVIDSSTPIVTPPAETVTLTANPDSYQLTKGSGDQPGMATAVSANDVFDTSAQFTVVSLPKHGTVKMFDLGFFEYTPAPDFTGNDSFTYQLSQNGDTSTATANITVYDPETKTSFTAIKPSPDSKLIYVSSSEGSDTNTCLAPSAPCKSVGAALEKMRSGYPDHVYLKRGDAWRGESISRVASGRSAQEPAVVSYYGTGPRPLIENSTSTGTFNKGDRSYVNFIGLHMSAYKLDPSHAEFTGDGAHKANITFLGANKNVLFEDNIFDHVEVVVQRWDGSGGRPSDFSFRRNIFTGAYYNGTSYSQANRPSNMYIQEIDGLVIEENVLDYGGWHPTVTGAGANMYNHNIYLQHGSDGDRIFVRKNIITRGSSHGIQMRSGGTADNNFFGRNALSLLIGYSVKPLETGVMACGINNVVTEGHSMVKGSDACSGTNLCTPAIWGIDFDTHGEANWQAYNNIVHSLAPNDIQWKSMWSKLVLHSYRLKNEAVVKRANNHSWHWTSTTEGDSNGYADPGRTLGDYYTHLRQQNIISKDAAGSDNFDKFMTVVKNRAPGSWPEALTADALNDYIRAGFGVKDDAVCN